MSEAVLVLPHQLFSNHPCIDKNNSAEIFLIEDPLFFKDQTYYANFHKQKLIFHRASMKAYQEELKKRGFKTHYIEIKQLLKGTESYVELFEKNAITKIVLADPVDNMVEKRLCNAAKQLAISIDIKESPAFSMTNSQIDSYYDLDHYSFTPFYIKQRKRLHILILDKNKPTGGKWTFDSDNRKKAPSHFSFPTPYVFTPSNYVKEAIAYVEKNFKDNLGKAASFAYATTSKEAKKALEDFLENRLEAFGPYQDAILQSECQLMHSILSPYLNSGLLTPHEVVEAVITYAKSHKIPLNSLEGFLRQVIGWREFVRVVYKVAHVQQRTCNFWGHHRPLTTSFYEGSTGIEPIDNVIGRLKESAYCHHIERLMLLGSFMLLCEFDPNAVYLWFMEFFIDSYDWVMVPNVYGMSQYADGGLMTTKPYLCSSNYILKMSNFKKGPWCQIWDALFWRFIDKHQKFFAKQPRLIFIYNQLKKMDAKKLQDHISRAESYLSIL